ncbi:MAG: TIM barrel protein [Nitrospiraceae bacterium]|nr:TIM barrel protein [Nitrospiraceae bacterium]
MIHRQVLVFSLILAIGLLAAGGACQAAEPGPGAPNAEKLGWRLGCQAYSFNRFTFFEAVDKVHSLGLKYIEMYGGQPLNAEKPDVKTGPGMSAEDRALVKAKLAECGIKLVNFGVTGLSNDEAQCREVFDFAKDMGIETICSEPPKDAFDLIDKLCQEYDINVALHNHPKPSRYWNPDTVLEVCEGRSKYIGACADTGHWMRSGIEPLEAVKKLEGRIVTFHFKDLNEFGKRAHDVPWGTGKANVKAILEEVHRQGLEAVFSIEYEHNWENSLPEIAESVAYFDKVAAELADAK